jgi:hypothetical protein
VGASLEILLISPPDGMVGAFYTHTFQAVNGTSPYGWSIASGSLPPGLSLDSALGKVSGTPTAAGTYNFVLKVEDSSSPAQTASAAFSILIEPPGGTLNITTTSLPDGTIGVAYSETVTALGGIVPYTWSISGGSLPDGLNLNSSTGEISGTPTKDGTFDFTVKVADSGTPVQEATKLFTIIIAPLEIITTSLSNGNVGTPYNATLQAQGGNLPYTWSISSGSLPDDLNLNGGTGGISGTPTKDGTFNFTVVVEDSSSNTDSKPLSITVTTGGGTGAWGTPVALPKPAAGDTPSAATGQPCQYPDIEVGSAIYVVFGVQWEDGSLSTLRYAFGTGSSDGLTWAAPKLLDDQSRAHQPRIAKDSSGKAHILVAERTTGGGYELYHHTTTDGINYAKERAVGQQYHAHCVDIAVDGANNVHITWQSDDDYGNGNTNALYKKRTSSGWGSRIGISGSMVWISGPRITTDNSNNPHVAMYVGARINYTYSSNGGSTWPLPGRAANGFALHNDIELVSNSTGIIHIVWPDANGVHCVTSDGSGDWLVPVDIDPAVSSSCGLAIDSNNILHVVFDGVYYTKSEDSGATWSTPVCISGGGGSMPSIAVDSSNQLHAVWSSGNKIYYCTTK